MSWYALLIVNLTLAAEIEVEFGFYVRESQADFLDYGFHPELVYTTKVEYLDSELNVTLKIINKEIVETELIDLDFYSWTTLPDGLASPQLTIQQSQQNALTVYSITKGFLLIASACRSKAPLFAVQ